MHTQRPALFEAAPPTTLLRTIACYALGALLLVAGTSHLTFARAEFVAQVPRWVPLGEDFIVVASGVVELSLGFALIVLRRWRVPVGLAAAAFFIAIFPGNLSQYANHIDAFGLDTDAKRFIRLFFQPVLVIWALWSTGSWAWLRGKSERAAG